ncbi:MAG: hypothetical protein R6V83_14295 [Candidatus Thorarchaeota archaeon]
MRKRSREKKHSAAIDRRMDRLDPDDIRKAIYAIDGYRQHAFYELTHIDKMVENRTLGRKFAEIWKPLRRKMVKMARVTSSIPGLVRLATIQTYTEALWQIPVPILFIMLFVGLFFPDIPFVGAIAPYVMITTFAAILIGVGARYIIGGMISKRINNFFEENPEVNKAREKEVRKAVQLLIEQLRQYISHKDENPEDHLVGVGLLDYNHIEVVKEPKPWRKHYLVKLT